jgi:hypothetical protein
MTKQASVVAKAGATDKSTATRKVDPDVELFAENLQCCVNGLLACNASFQEGFPGEIYEPEELLKLAVWYAEQMEVAVHEWRDDREVEKFESRRKNEL